MQNEAAFLAAIRDRPHDETLRLIYADWLEERGDARAEFIRNQHELTKTPYGDVQHYRIHARQRYLRDSTDRAWLEAMDYRHWPIELTADNFEREVLGRPGVAVVRFWAPWSAPCIAFGAAIEELADDSAGLAVVGNVNIDEQPELAMQHEVAAIPTTLLFARGQLALRLIGLRLKSHVADRLATLINQTRTLSE